MLDLPDARSLSDFELPRLVQLGENLYAASFFLMKLLPARHILDRAEAEGRLMPGGVIAETTSGTFGLALAILARLRGYRLILVSDPAIDPPFCRRLEELGARVEIVAAPAPEGGFQQARLDRLADVLARHPGAFWPQQYSNPANPAAYLKVAQQLGWRIGRVDCLVGTVGSGGSVCGTAAGLRRQQRGLHVVGIDTPGSVLFGQPDAPRALRGLGNSILPPNLEHSAFDEVHWIGAGCAFAATRRLHREKALFCGPTSGAAFMVAEWWAAQHPERTVVVLLPDEGNRYIDTIYNDEWLARVPGSVSNAASGPLPVTEPNAVAGSWSTMLWNRRTLKAVLADRAIGEAA